MGIFDSFKVKRLIKNLDNSTMYVDDRVKLIKPLVEIGEPAVEPLIQALKDIHKYVREGAAEALRTIGDERAVEPLIQAVNYDDYMRAKAALIPDLQEYVKSCLTLQYHEIADDRLWNSISEVADLGDGSSLSEYSKRTLVESLIVQYPDFDHVYRWSGIYHNRGGNNNEAIEILKEGLKVCKRKYNLYEELGNIEYQRNHLLDAVHWWIQSILSQKSIGQHDNRNPFLYLSYICGRLDLNDIRSELGIYAAGISLTPQAANEVYHRVDNETKIEYIRQALLELHRYLESEY